MNSLLVLENGLLDSPREGLQNKRVPKLFQTQKVNDFSDSEDDSYEKYSYYPIEHPELEHLTDEQAGSFWTVEEIEFDKDVNDWIKLSPDIKKFIKFILCFFTQADGLVIENLSENFQRETGYIKECRAFYTIQNAIETIHNKAYSTFVDILITDREEKKRAFNAIKYYPAIRKMAMWVKKWMDSSLSLIERVVAFACVEGVMFTGAFCAIYWLKRRNILPGLCQANEWIARDEGIHTRFAIALYHVLTIKRGDAQPLLRERVYEIVDSAVSTNEVFIREALQVNLVGMSAGDMMQYIKRTADGLIESLGYAPLYKAINPFDWMAIITLQNKTNFFEQRPTEYGKQAQSEFDWDEDAEY